MTDNDDGEYYVYYWYTPVPMAHQTEVTGTYFWEVYRNQVFYSDDTEVETLVGVYTDRKEADYVTNVLNAKTDQ